MRLPGLRAVLPGVRAPLVNQQELLGLRLLTLHNLWFTLRLTAGARDAITRGAFDAYRRDVLASLAAGPKEEPWQA